MTATTVRTRRNDSIEGKDAVGMYLAEIARTPLLDAAREVELSKVIEAGPWSDEQVEAERRRDRAAKARFYGQTPAIELAVQPAPVKAAPGFWRRAWRWLSGRS